MDFHQLYRLDRPVCYRCDLEPRPAGKRPRCSQLVSKRQFGIRVDNLPLAFDLPLSVTLVRIVADGDVPTFFKPVRDNAPVLAVAKPLPDGTLIGAARFRNKIA